MRLDNSKFWYILDLSNLDSLIACEYLFHTVKTNLTYIIIDKKPSNTEEKTRLANIQTLLNKSHLLSDEYNTQILIDDKPETDEYKGIVFCGAPFHIASHYIDNTTAQCSFRSFFATGGYENGKIEPNFLRLFYENEIFTPEEPSVAVEALENIDRRTQNRLNFYTERVTSSRENIITGKLWEDDKLAIKLCSKYNLPSTNSLRYTLMVREALIDLSIIKRHSYGVLMLQEPRTPKITSQTQPDRSIKTLNVQCNFSHRLNDFTLIL